MNLNTIHNVYFIGIGGIGMSALARYFHSLGKRVGGYDKTPTKITTDLIDQGMKIHFNDAISEIEEVFKNSENTLVVYTPAIPDSHSELSYFKANNFKVQKRAQVLGLITKDTFCFAVAGTHGKTTTSSILGHILKVCNADMTAFLGGITENYHSNLILNGNKISVVEADEFDRSFLQLSPDVACITSMDADHLDIYGEASALVESFLEFSEKLTDTSKLFVKKGLPLNGVTYAVNDTADYSIQDISVKNGSYVFSIQTPTEKFKDVVFNLPGHHNLANALVAFAMAYDYGFDAKTLIKGLQSFSGVERRFTYQIKTDKNVFIDDYAHHPTAIDAVYHAVEELYPNKKTVVVFQPHLFSRTQDFAQDFASSLSRFNTVRLLDIYPARELPIEGVTSEWLLSKITNADKKVIGKDAIFSEVIASEAPIVITLGAGDIGVLISDLKNKLVNYWK